MIMSVIKKFLQLSSSIIICQAAGILGALFTQTSISKWYKYLEKPDFAPSGRFISRVWTFLYTLMGISLYLVWQKGIDRPEVKRAIEIFGIQLLLNVLWSWAFFYIRSPLKGLGVISALWISILAMIIKFSKISKTASLLLVPYILWTSFAAYLNYKIWDLNPKRNI